MGPKPWKWWANHQLASSIFICYCFCGSIVPNTGRMTLSVTNNSVLETRFVSSPVMCEIEGGVEWVTNMRTFRVLLFRNNQKPTAAKRHIHVRCLVTNLVFCTQNTTNPDWWNTFVLIVFGTCLNFTIGSHHGSHRLAVYVGYSEAVPDCIRWLLCQLTAIPYQKLDSLSQNWIQWDCIRKGSVI